MVKYVDNIYFIAPKEELENLWPSNIEIAKQLLKKNSYPLIENLISQMQENNNSKQKVDDTFIGYKYKSHTWTIKKVLTDVKLLVIYYFVILPIHFYY